MCSDEEYERYQEAVMNGTDENFQFSGKITDMPDNFKQWMEDNRERIARAEERGTLPYFLRENTLVHVNNSIKQNAENVFPDRYELYQNLKKDPNYKDVEFNERGGVKATHVNNHPGNEEKERKYFGELTGAALEKECQNEIFRIGGTCILNEEGVVGNDGNTISCLDARINGKIMDIRSITSEGKSYINQFTEKAKQLTRYNSKHEEKSDSLCLYFHESGMYSEEKMQLTIDRFRLLKYMGRQGQVIPSDILKFVYVVIKGRGAIIEYKI